MGTICRALEKPLCAIMHMMCANFFGGTVHAEIDRAIFLDAVTDNPTAAVGTLRSQRMDRALKRIESMPFAVHDDLKRFVVLVSTIYGRL